MSRHGYERFLREDEDDLSERSWNLDHYGLQGERNPSRRINLKPDYFDGKEDFDTYLESFEAITQLGGYSETEKALTLAACLRGQARRFYAGLSKREKSVYDELKYQLQQRFGTGAKPSVYYTTQLENRHKKATETVADFADELVLLSSKAYPHLDRYSQNSIALQQFYKSMPPEVKWRCIEQGCKTLRDAEEVAELYETIMEKDKKVRQVRFESPNRSNYEQDREKTELRHQSSPAGKFKRECYCCHEDTHLMMDCPVYKRCKELEAKLTIRRSRSPSPSTSPKTKEN